jgi:very-short-patch-repair endonuclease
MIAMRAHTSTDPGFRGLLMAIEHVAALDALAKVQHGLVTTDQAVRLLGPSRKSRWVSERRLLSVQPSVFRLSGSPETWHQAVHAAALAADAIVSHRSAAELWGLVPPCGHVDVSITPERRPRLRPPAVAHRILDLRPDLAVEREAMMLTDPVRTIIDLGLVLPIWSVGAALGRGLSTGLLTIGQAKDLREALGRRGRNGTGIAGELIERRLLTGGGDQSELETRFDRIVRRYDLPPAILQHEVWQAGRFVARIDAAYPDLKLAIEVDGYEHHSSPEAFQRDRTRQNRLVALGWTVLRFTWADIVRRPAAVAQAIREAIARHRAA